MPDTVFNFARRPFRDYRSVHLVAGGALLVGVILFAVNASVYGRFRREMSDTRDEIAWLEKRQRQATTTAEAARGALRNYELSALAGESRGLLRLVEERRFSWIQLLGRLERVLPPEVRLARLQPKFEEDGEIVVDVALLGPSQDSVVRTIAALSRSPYFTTIDLKSESRPEDKTGTPEGYTFQLSAVYGPKAAP